MGPDRLPPQLEVDCAARTDNGLAPESIPTDDHHLERPNLWYSLTAVGCGCERCIRWDGQTLTVVVFRRSLQDRSMSGVCHDVVVKMK
jgi:hypothetical protein